MFPGDFDCRREQPHAKWHEESANAFADAMELTLFLDRFLRTGNDPATGGAIDAAPWQCLLDNKCLDIYGSSSSPPCVCVCLSLSLSLSVFRVCLSVCLVCLPVRVLSYGSVHYSPVRSCHAAVQSGDFNPMVACVDTCSRATSGGGGSGSEDNGSYVAGLVGGMAACGVAIGGAVGLALWHERRSRGPGLLGRSWAESDSHEMMSVTTGQASANWKEQITRPR